MEEPDKTAPDRESNRLAEERQRLEEEYKKRGAQSISYKDYIAQREKKRNRKKITIPLHIKFILGTPFLILFGYGIFFIPWIIYVVLTHPEEKAADRKKDETSIADKKDRTTKERTSRR
ncbi:MAG TPA: hypothetical protein PLT76_05935 [Candidatus Omnitrophota bacterium]|nr:hypothetical protein [Candidatus Omnitrophota bacterium]HPB68093.1 hypothetical protein [Candidatus Omnitrophota bacterium]HQO58244.1 hypothetical protein [Candidatus Omnitrophota bacterium]HQP11265.1 hypothetical protein [Candidatus Omnitrophota bacterium]